jgi:hypothetical protein
MLAFNKFIQKKSTVSLLRDNARPHTSVSSNEAITIFGWTALPHPPQSGFHMFHHLKGSLQEYHYVDEK